MAVYDELSQSIENLDLSLSLGHVDSLDIVSSIPHHHKTEGGPTFDYDCTDVQHYISSFHQPPQQQQQWAAPTPYPSSCDSVSSSSSTLCSSTYYCTLNDNCQGGGREESMAAATDSSVMMEELNQSIEDLDLSLTIGHVVDLDNVSSTKDDNGMKQGRDHHHHLGKGMIHCSLSHQPTASTSCPSYESLSSSLSSSFTTLNDSRHRHEAVAEEQQQQQQQLYHYPITCGGRPSNILNDYTILPSILGNGCYGIVRECIHHRTQQSFAVKSIDKAKITRLDHLRREIDLLACIQHPSIIQLIDCYEDSHYVHIITEMCAGGELYDRIEERFTTSNQGCFDERSAARIIKSLLEAVAYLHANGIIHRDIKPENILFDSSTTSDDEEEYPSIKLIDFGLARRHRHGIDPPLSKFRGTIYYLSPELLLNCYSSPTDVWSTGVIAYILLAGYPPFDGDTDPEIYASIAEGNVEFPSFMGWSDKSPQCIDFIKGLLTKDPCRRFTAQEALLHPFIVGMSR